MTENSGSNILLSISIPTYNRSVFLDRCLNNFSQQESLNLVEILVSNNGSNDDTSLIIDKYKKSFPFFTIIHNDENKGMDFNISQCFEKAIGKYVWVFGDDDFVAPYTLAPVLKILRENNYGLLHLKPSYDIKNSAGKQGIAEIKDITVFDDALDFFSQLHYWATFISSNIVNKILVKNIDPRRFKNTYLPQLSWVIPAIFAGQKNIIIKDAILFCEPDNTGGYKFYEVFGKNYNLILDSLIKDGIDKRIKTTTNQNLLSSFFPMFIHQRSTKFEKEEYIKILFPVFWRYGLFWKNIMRPYFKTLLKTRKL